MSEEDVRVLAKANYKKALYFLENQEQIHVSLRSGKWYNGVVRKVEEDYFILNDRMEGDVPVFYLELTWNGITKYDEKPAAD
jgi:hypothetical protein